MIEARVQDYLARYDVPAREAIDVRWAQTCMALEDTVERLEEVLSPVLVRRMQAKLWQALYFGYDYAQDYLPQLEANLQTLGIALCILEVEGDVLAKGSGQRILKALRSGIQCSVLHQLADADLIGGALGGGIVRAGRGIVRAGGGCLRLGAAAGGKGQRHGRSQNKSEQFLFHSDLLLLSVSGRIHKVGYFPKKQGGLSMEQSPLAFNG